MVATRRAPRRLTLTRFAGQSALEMRTGRLEAFSDGVLAILITIMVLERPAWLT
jgi:Endosomal/lysosomal potassium channel TMEM175